MRSTYSSAHLQGMNPGEFAPDTAPPRRTRTASPKEMLFTRSRRQRLQMVILRTIVLLFYRGHLASRVQRGIHDCEKPTAENRGHRLFNPAQGLHVPFAAPNFNTYKCIPKHTSPSLRRDCASKIPRSSLHLLEFDLGRSLQATRVNGADAEICEAFSGTSEYPLACRVAINRSIPLAAAYRHDDRRPTSEYNPTALRTHTCCFASTRVSTKLPWMFQLEDRNWVDGFPDDSRGQNSHSRHVNFNLANDSSGPRNHVQHHSGLARIQHTNHQERLISMEQAVVEESDSILRGSLKPPPGRN